MARVNPFPYPVQSVADLPEHFQQAVRLSLKPGEQVNSILMFPPQPFIKRGGVPQQTLLSTSQGLLHVEEKDMPDQPPAVTCLPGEALLYAHHSLLLLYGCLELAGEVDGRSVRMVIEYNTVGQPLLDAVLKQYLRFTYGWADTEKSYNPQSNSLLDELGMQSFKFMNGLRLYALQPGERLLGVVFQPRITRTILRFFRHAIAPSSLLALTDQTVILIEEDKARGAAYGWLITLCPRKFVAKIESKPNHEWCDVTVRLLRNTVSEERKLTLETESALAWETLWAGKNQIER
jgi:hypothetical protein